jgi:molecular chaperone HscB
MNLQDNDFALFALPEQFTQERARIDAQWKALQKYAHPDQFVSQGAAAQRIAMQWSVRINEAYARLKDPLKRAAYLCELRGAPIAAHTNTAMPAAFLMQQMHWREELEEATRETELDALTQELDAAVASQTALLTQHLDTQPDALAAAGVVRALMFMEKFRQDMDDRYDHCDRLQG